MQYKDALDGLFAQVLAVMQSQGLIELQRVTQDGTKIQAAGSKASLHQNDPVVAAFVEKMKTTEAQAIYRQRKQIAVSQPVDQRKTGLRRFRVRCRVKATCEMLWACLTYNIQQWIRLRWRPQLVMATI